MKILKLLNNKLFINYINFFLICFDLKAEDKPIDIWNIDQNQIEETEI